MHVARRTSRNPPSVVAARVLLLTGLALLLIIGLLGMHTLSGDADGHRAPAVMGAPMVAVGAGMDHATMADHDAGPVVCAGSCLSGSAGEHESMATACILALLVGLLVLLLPPLLTRLDLRRLLRISTLPSVRGLRLPAGPSLIFLSISRT